jgi:CBS domain-containing protein
LAEVHVGDFVAPTQSLLALHAQDSLNTVVGRFGNSPFPVLPVVDDKGRLLGVVDLEEVNLVALEPSMRPLVLAVDLMLTDVRPLTPNDTLDRALELFIENDLLALPVVNDLEERKVMATVRRFEIANAYLQHIHGPIPTAG